MGRIQDNDRQTVGDGKGAKGRAVMQRCREGGAKVKRCRDGGVDVLSRS